MREGNLQWEGLTTWYGVVGDGDGVPVVICHGGPGATHDYLKAIAELSSTGRAAVLYDQVGNGKSQHLRDAPPAFWTVDLFKRELATLVEHLGYAQLGYHVVGHGWGGMLAMEHALEQPRGLRSITVADAPASIGLWVEEADRLRALLPRAAQQTLLRHEADGTASDPAYRAAVQAFHNRHVCRLDPWPRDVMRTLALIDEDPTVSEAMNGPRELRVTGTIRHWDISARLREIDVPALLVSGRYDRATPRIVGEMQLRIPRAQWVLFEQSSHMPHVEEAAHFLEVVGGFLGRVDAAR